MRYAVIALCAAVLLTCRKETVANAPAGGTPQTQKTATTGPAKENLAGKKVELEAPLRPETVSECRVGATLDKGGLVTEKKTTFEAKEPIFVSMWLTEAPHGLAVAVRTLDAKREELSRVQMPASGAKAVTLRVGQLNPGKYILESLWGGNWVCEDTIEVH